MDPDFTALDFNLFVLLVVVVCVVFFFFLILSRMHMHSKLKPPTPLVGGCTFMHETYKMQHLTGDPPKLCSTSHTAFDRARLHRARNE